MNKLKLNLLLLTPILLLLIGTFGCSSDKRTIQPTSTVPGAQPTETIEDVQNVFANEVASDQDGYQIFENTDAANQYGYLDLFFADKKLLTKTDKEARHLEFRSDDPSLSVDLSIFRLNYPSGEEALEAATETWGSERTGMKPDGKVLTRYAVKISTNAIFVLRTLDTLDPDVKAFFEKFADKP